MNDHFTSRTKAINQKASSASKIEAHPRDRSPGSTRRTVIRTALGFVAAPLFPGVVVWLIPAVANVSDLFEPWALYLFAGMLMTSAALGYPVALLLGIPTYAVLRAREWNGVLAYALTIPFLGCFPYVELRICSVELISFPTFYAVGVPFAYFWNSRPRMPVPPPDISWLPAGMIFTAIAVAAFWLIARPEKSDSPEQA